MKALIVLDCQKGMLARGDFDLLRENILKLQEMFKASGDLIIHTRHIDENEESIIYNGDERGGTRRRAFCGCGFYRRKRLAKYFPERRVEGDSCETSGR